MNNNYFDILALTSTPPIWWDENAVPRWCKFKPEYRANIYADEVVLLLIRCQHCGQEFKVCCSRGTLGCYPPLLKSTKRLLPIFSLLRRLLYWIPEPPQEKVPPQTTIEGLIRCNGLRYGDPPNVDCCEYGPSMSAESVQVLEYWSNKKWEWIRNPILEVSLDEDLIYD